MRRLLLQRCILHLILSWPACCTYRPPWLGSSFRTMRMTSSWHAFFLDQRSLWHASSVQTKSDQYDHLANRGIALRAQPPATLCARLRRAWPKIQLEDSHAMFGHQDERGFSRTSLLFPRAIMRSIRLAFALASVLLTTSLLAQTDAPVRITLKPRGIVHGTLLVPVSVSPEVDRIELSLNGLETDEKRGRSVVFSVPIGNYIRRLRVRATGYDASGALVGEDEMAVDDPQPPFRIHLSAPRELPAGGTARLTATVSAEPGVPIDGVDFYVGEQKIATVTQPPFAADFDPAGFKDAAYARATARSAGTEANDVAFWGSRHSESLNVVVEQLPLSITGSSVPLRKEELSLSDNGDSRTIEALTPASDRPLSVILLIDSSESMLKELPIVREAARSFARAILGPKDRMAVVKFSDQPIWLTPFTSDLAFIDRSLEDLHAAGETHLYDTVISMMYELQKQPGRHALVVLTDAVDQGSSFTLDNVVHYARYSGVPIYPIVENPMLARMAHLPLFKLKAQQFAELSRESGARYFIIRKTSELPPVYAAIAAELRQQYLLSFQVDSDGRDLWHPLAISTSRKDVEIRLPRGYFP
jgi:VWFA-related protein